MKKNYSNPSTEINWWIGDTICETLGDQYTENPSVPGKKGGGLSINTSSPS